jgi:hypothetical protein
MSLAKKKNTAENDCLHHHVHALPCDLYPFLSVTGKSTAKAALDGRDDLGTGEMLLPPYD